MSSLRTALRPLAAVVPLALLVSTGQAAVAATRTVHDPAGDTYSMAGDLPAPKPSTKGDITSVSTAHRAARVVVTIRMRDLPGDSVNMGLVRIKTSNPGRDYFVTGVAGAGFKLVQLSKGMAQDVTCRGLRMAIRPADDVIRAEVPRTCLGAPRWVRTGAAVVTTTSDSVFADTPDASAEPDGYADVAGVGAVDEGFWESDGTRLPLGPKVRRG